MIWIMDTKKQMGMVIPKECVIVTGKKSSWKNRLEANFSTRMICPEWLSNSFNTSLVVTQISH